MEGKAWGNSPFLQKRFPSLPQSLLLLFKHEREDVVDAVHGVDDDLAAELLRDFFQILLVLGGEDDVADAARNPGEHLFLDAAHGQDAPAQGDFARHADVAAHGLSGQRGDERRHQRNPG